MGLSLRVLDKHGDELYGVEVGRYEYFVAFREAVTLCAQQGKFDVNMDPLLQHSDCDGMWSICDCEKLIEELTTIQQVFIKESPRHEIMDQKQNVLKLMGMTPKNLYECFVDSDCEFLIDRLLTLCHVAIDQKQPILFQ